MEYFSHQEEKNYDYFEAGTALLLKIKEKISFKILIQIFMIFFSLLFFYYFNKDKSLFKKIFNRT